MPITTLKPQGDGKFPQIQRKETEAEVLNTKLKAIIQQIPVNWENANEVRRIDKIIKGKNNYLKRAAIVEYKIK